MLPFVYRFTSWIRDPRRAGYLKPVSVTVAITALLMLLYKGLEERFFPTMPVWQSRLNAVVVSCTITGVMAFLALQIYRQMARDTIEELTKRLRLNEELIKERNLIESLMQSSVDRISFKDLDSRYIRASRSVAETFKLSRPDEVVGRSDFDFYTEECAQFLRREEQAVIRSGKPIVGRAVREEWLDGRETWASVTIVPLRERQGAVVGTLSIARDITESRAKEERIRQLSRAVEQSPHMVVITDRAGKIEYVNPRFTEITGYTLDEAIGQTPRILRSGAHGPAFYQQMWATILAGNEWRGEILNRRKNSDLFWVRTVISPIRNSAGEITHLVSVAEDISREKEQAEQIQREQARRKELEHIISRGPAIVFLWRNEPGWPVEYVSENVAQWGYSAEDLTSGRIPYAQVIHPDDLARVADEVRHYTEGGIDNYIQEYRIIQKGGEVRWVEDRTWTRRGADGKVSHYQGVVLDITERKQAEQAQQALLEGLRTVLAMADDLFACPTEDALYLRAVELARERLRLERCGILVLEGDRLHGTYGTGLQGETTDEHKLVFAVDEVWRERLKPRGSHEKRWILSVEPHRVWRTDHIEELPPGWVAITPIQSSAQEVIGAFCNDTAISRAPPDSIVQEIVVVFCSLLANMVLRKRAEEEQLRSRAEQREIMERADRLNSLGLLAAGIAHEINNPLQGMLSHVRAIGRALPGESSAQHNLQMVERGIESIASLVRKLLYLGSSEKSVESADARECAEFVLQLLAEPMKKSKILVESRFPASRMILAIPRQELIQVLLNLLINARDAMPDGGQITLVGEAGARTGTIRISDTGPGIPPDILSRIFLPFFTTKGTKGTGLGLSVAESLIRSKNGKITVESQVGRGATFIVELPLREVNP
ncbi:MAG: PAS domain S-box protein [Kiritimatiellae bacterium]|nr:PAS domain S-box protein [Kiritimatiellia bacterium]MDW8458338.1 PAS domain S-box protein [Verrucomicrobiota bacterium]